MDIFSNFWVSFLAGLFAPIGAVCVIPLYPGFIAYLASQVSGEGKRKSNKKIILMGWIVALGIIVSMFIIGLIFTVFFQSSLTNIISIVSPIAFGVLAIVSLFLIFNIDIGRIFPKITTPTYSNPFLTAFIFGFFFGLIILPCNPASLIVLFALSTSTIGFLTNLVNFILFGIGMALPLLIITYISKASGQKFIEFLTSNKRIINLIAGIIMLGISLYYLMYVFNIFNI